MFRGPRRHRRRIEEPHHGRYLTFTCYRRLPLLGHEAIRDAFAAHLERTRSTLGFRLLAWVIMPEHVHLVLIPALPKAPVPRIFESLKGPFARRVIRRWRELDAPILRRITDARGRCHLWQRGGGHDWNVVRDEKLLEKISYIHGNPIRRGIVHEATDWRWSSAQWYAGERDGPVRIDSPS